MKVRIALGLGGAELTADDFAALVADLAGLGFDSLWISEILTGPGPDPLIALTTAAQLHPKLKLGTTMLLPGRNENPAGQVARHPGRAVPGPAAAHVRSRPGLRA